MSGVEERSNFDVKMVKLGDVVGFHSGGTPSRSKAIYFQGNIPWITGADISENRLITPRSFITEDAVLDSATRVLPAGTIVLVTRTSLEEQRRIAEILDWADEIRAKRRQQLAHLDTLTQSIFHDMFGGQGNYAEFGSVIAEGATNGLYRPMKDYGSGTPILRIDSFDRGVVQQQEWKRVRIPESEISRFGLCNGDLVINRVNALSHLGKAAVIDTITEPSVYESNMMRIRLDEAQVVSTFVNAWLQTASARRQILGKAKKAINQASINQSDVRALRLPVPALSFQIDFANRVKSIRAQRAAVERALAADNELFASLQSRAFRGEL